MQRVERREHERVERRVREALLAEDRELVHRAQALGELLIAELVVEDPGAVVRDRVDHVSERGREHEDAQAGGDAPGGRRQILQPRETTRTWPLHRPPIMPAASATSAATLLLVRSVLHVLPHPGGGGETYVDTLERMGGFEFERLFLAPSPEPPRSALRTLCRTGVALQLLARSTISFTSTARWQAVSRSRAWLSDPRGDAERPASASPPGRHPAACGSRELRAVVAAATRRSASPMPRGTGPSRSSGRARGAVAAVPNSVDLAPRRPPSGAPGPPRPRTAADAAVGAGSGASTCERIRSSAARAASRSARRGTRFMLLVAGDGPLRPRSSSSRRTRRRAHPGFPPATCAPCWRVGPIRRLVASRGAALRASRGDGQGLPAVVSDEPGTIEGVGDAGLVVPSPDVGVFADGLAELARDEPRRLELGRRARERVAAHYPPDEMLEDRGRLRIGSGSRRR